MVLETTTSIRSVVSATHLSDVLDLPADFSYDECVHSLPLHWIKQNSTEIKRKLGGNILRLALEKHGFVVISDVATQQECNKLIHLGCNWIDAATAVETRMIEQTEAAAPAGTFPVALASLEGGILPFYGAGHSTCAWMARSLVRPVFEALYETENLISSLDGLVFWCNTNTNDSSSKPPTDAGWFHVDQNPRNKPDFAAVQGLLNLLPVTESTGGNALVAQSHRNFPHYLDAAGPCGAFYQTRLDEVNGDDWLEVDPDDEQVLHPERILSLLLRPGDFLLWDSRVAHCSYPPLATAAGAASSPDFLIRAATLVSMMPANSASPSALQARKEAVDMRRTLTHWANQVSPLGAERPELLQLEHKRVELMNSGSVKVLLGWDDLSDEQKALVAGKSFSSPSA